MHIVFTVKFLLKNFTVKMHDMFARFASTETLLTMFKKICKNVLHCILFAELLSNLWMIYNKQIQN